MRRLRRSKAHKILLSLKLLSYLLPIRPSTTSKSQKLIKCFRRSKTKSKQLLSNSNLVNMVMPSSHTKLRYKYSRVLLKTSNCSRKSYHKWKLLSSTTWQHAVGKN